jgi:hypothetical protein
VSSTVTYADAGGAQAAFISQIFLSGSTPTDPAVLTLTVTDPLGAITTYTYLAGTVIARNSAGNFTASVPVTSDGLWSFFWIATGGPQPAVQAGTFAGVPETAGNSYVGAAELKSRLGITDTAFDFEISRACLAAQADVEQFTGRYFWQSAGVRTYRNHSIYDVEIDDTVSVTTLKTDGDGDGVYETVWTASQFQLQVTQHEYNVSGKGEPWPYTKIQALGVPGGNYLPYVWAWSHQDRVQVTGVFGWPKIPFNVREAALLLAVDHFKIKDAPFGIAGFSEYGPVRVVKNPVVASLLHRYIRPRTKVGV